MDWRVQFMIILECNVQKMLYTCKSTSCIFVIYSIFFDLVTLPNTSTRPLGCVGVCKCMHTYVMVNAKQITSIKMVVIFAMISTLRFSGTSLHVITGLNIVMAVIVSAAVAVFYTLIGQMISVAYTDVVELIFLLGGLVSFIY